jgi:lipooligosaccharide transport system ATP-binding protein
MSYIIEAENLRKTFRDFTAVDGVSFQVRKGECFGLLGPNGAGKTSTIRMLYGYSPITGGSLKVFSKNLAENMRAIKYRIGVCQQEDNLDPDLTVQQNLLVFARYFNIPGAQAEEETRNLLQFFALSHRARANIRELSGGMKRRLVLARALINNPELLILDEPITGLDPQSRHQVWQRLEELRAKGLTILLTTHYMEEAARLCDSLIIMDQGRILVQGKPADLVRQHVGREVIEVAEPSAAMRHYLQTRKLDFEDLGHRLVVYGQAGDSLFIHLTRGFNQDGCTLRLATLEDVFLRLTGRELRE